MSANCERNGCKHLRGYGNFVVLWGAAALVLFAVSFAAACRKAPSGVPAASAPGEELREIALGPDTRILLRTRPFDGKRHQVRRCKGVPCLVDEKPVYGAYGDLPDIEIVSLVLRTGSRDIPLDTSAMYNPWSPREDRDVHIWLSRELGERLLIRGEFSDGAGAYFAEWEVVEGSAIRTVLKCAECLSMTCQALER